MIVGVHAISLGHLLSQQHLWYLLVAFVCFFVVAFLLTSYACFTSEKSTKCLRWHIGVR